MHYDCLFDYRNSMSSNTIFYLLAAATYAGLAGLLWRPLVHHQELSARLSPATRVALLAALILHGLGLAQSIVLPQGLYLGWAVGLSAALWLGMVCFVLSQKPCPAISKLFVASTAYFRPGHHGQRAVSPGQFCL